MFFSMLVTPQSVNRYLMLRIFTHVTNPKVNSVTMKPNIALYLAWVHFNSLFDSLRYVSVLSFYLCLHHWRDLFAWDFSVKSFYFSFMHPTFHALLNLDVVTAVLLCAEDKLWSILSCIHLQYPFNQISDMYHVWVFFSA